MNDRLEDFIRNNREEFDAHEPDPALWEKVVTGEPKRKTRKLTPVMILWRAAAVVAIFVASWFVHDIISGTGSNPDNPVADNRLPENCAIPDDVTEAEIYYVNQVSYKLKEVYSFTNNDPEIKKEIEYDFSELDSIYIDLKNDLCDDVDNEEVIDAMIQNYRIKLQILEDMLSYLKNNNENESEYENPEYEL